MCVQAPLLTDKFKKFVKNEKYYNRSTTTETLQSQRADVMWDKDEQSAMASV